MFTRRASAVITAQLRKHVVRSAALTNTITAARPAFVAPHVTVLPHQCRSYAAAPSSNEQQIQKLLEDNIKPQFLRIFDISGGCGASFEIYSTCIFCLFAHCTYLCLNAIMSTVVVSEQFEGKTPVKQHRIVMDLLKGQFKEVHAMRLHTKTPKQFDTDVANGFITKD